MQRKYFGTTSDGIPVHIFHLESQSGVAVRVMEYGASLVSIETPDRYARTGPIVLGYDELSGYLGADSPLGSAPNASVNSSLNSSLSSSLNSSLSSSLNSSLNTGRAPACGATLGRYAGRIGDGAFRLSGSLHTVSKDDGSDRPGAGAAGLHRAVWWGEALSEGVRFHYRSPAGAEGYPGALDCSVEYRLGSEGELRLDYRATTDAPTVLDLTSQIYFNLNDAGRSPVIDHELTISADEIVETDRNGVPTGHFQRIVGSTLDFSSAKRLGEHAERPERPHNSTGPFYLLRRGAKTLRAVARISDPVSGRSLEVSTTQPGVSIASGSALRPKHGHKLYGLCLCPQNLPDAPNHRHFPSPGLAPGSAYHQTTVFRFGNDR